LCFKNIFSKSPRKFGSFQNFFVLVAKGETTPAFGEAKGGENVKPNTHELDKQRVFDSFCKKVLKYEARNCFKREKWLRGKEVSFSELSERELEQLSTTDKYFATEQTFNVLGTRLYSHTALRRGRRLQRHEFQPPRLSAYACRHQGR